MLWWKKAKQEKSLREELLEVVSGELRVEVREKMLELTENILKDLKPELDGKISTAVDKAVGKSIRDIRLVFPAWQDIERVVWDTAPHFIGREQLRGYLDQIRVDINSEKRETSTLITPATSVPLFVVGLGFPPEAVLEFEFWRQINRETLLIQTITGAMLKKWGMVPMFKTVVSDMVLVRVKSECAFTGSVILQYAAYV